MMSDKRVQFNVGVVLPAAGCGERMKLQTPKQFCEVNGRPLICFTIDCFHRLPWVHQIVISANKVHVGVLEKLSAQYGFDKVTVVEGGSTRHRSIHAAVTALQQVDPSVEVVVIHDAVRPLVSADLLTDVVTAAHTHGAAGVCRPLVSTVIARDAEHRMTESLDRSRYFNSEMPQAFQTSLIAKAYGQCTSEDLDFGTECLLLALKHGGVQPRILDGSADLWKVTYKKDLFAAEAILRERWTRVAVVQQECWSELADTLRTQLSALQLQVVEETHQEPCAGDNTPSTTTTTTNTVANTFIVLHPCPPPSPSPCDAALDPNTHTSQTGAGSLHSSRDHHAQGTHTHLADCPHTNSLNWGGGDQSDNQRSVVNRATEGGQCQCPSDVLLLDTLRSVHSQWGPRSVGAGGGQLVDVTVVHVFVADSQREGFQWQMGLSQALLRLSTECRQRGQLVYGVLASKERSVADVSEMTTSLVQRGHGSFSGQLFLVM